MKQNCFPIVRSAFLWLLVGALAARAGVIFYSHDTAGRLTAANYDNGNAVTYTYDPNGNLLQRTIMIPALVVGGGGNSTFKILSQLTFGPGGITVQWTSVAGQTYRLQYKNTLNDANWTDVPGDVQASTTNSAKTDPSVGAGATRFYRLEIISP